MYMFKGISGPISSSLTLTHEAGGAVASMGPVMPSLPPTGPTLPTVPPSAYPVATAWYSKTFFGIPVWVFLGLGVVAAVGYKLSKGR